MPTNTDAPSITTGHAERPAARPRRNRWKIAFFVMLGVSLLSVGYLAIEVVDQGITYTYASVSYEETQRSLAMMERLLPTLEGHARRAQLIELVRDQNPKAFIMATDSTIDVDGVVFHFTTDGRLRSVGR